MANITLTFNNALPEGIQVGDIAYYLDISTQTEIKMGPITSITNGPPTWTVIVNEATGVSAPALEDFVYYAKDPIASVGQLKGYYAEIQFINNTTNYAELYSVGTEVFESSK